MHETVIACCLLRSHPDRHEALRAIKDHVDTKKQPWVADMFDFSIDKTG
jgi:hypothetical protein